jgi:hypothetical protein
MQFEPGYFYSRVALPDDITQHFTAFSKRQLQELPGVDRQLAQQTHRCQKVAKYYSEQPFSETPTGRNRYYFDNETFVWSDALFLYGMLIALKPIQEIGPGFSSAAMLDTREAFCSGGMQMTFIEPCPDRRNKLLSGNVRHNCRIVERRLQDVTDAP